MVHLRVKGMTLTRACSNNIGNILWSKLSFHFHLQYAPASRWPTQPSTLPFGWTNCIKPGSRNIIFRFVKVLEQDEWGDNFRTNSPASSIQKHCCLEGKWKDKSTFGSTL